MAKQKWTAEDGPLQGEDFALEGDVDEFTIKLADGRVVVYRKGTHSHALLRRHGRLRLRHVTAGLGRELA